MKVLHGSSADFNEFRIEPSTSRYLAEGLGVYMTDTDHVANGYGNIVYTVQLNDDDISDFTDREYIESFYKRIASETGVDFYNEIDMEYIIDGILSGDASILDSPKEIYDNIDSDYNLYSKYESFMDDMQSILKKSFLEHVRDIIKYKSKDIAGTIFMCFRNESNLVIVDKQYID